MLCHRRGERLEAWASRSEASPVSELRGFTKGLRKDWAAVTAGLTVSYSSGPVEGHVNRIKMMSSSRGRFSPPALTEPYVTISRYTALAVLVTRLRGRYSPKPSGRRTGAWW